MEKPSSEWEKAMHISLNLYAEHEFNASTFTARVITGTGSDIYSSISGAIGALRGLSTVVRMRSLMIFKCDMLILKRPN